MGWSRSGRFALRSQTRLKKRISTKTWISLAIFKKVAQGTTLSRPSKSLRELNLLYAVTCVPARRKHCNADSWLRRGLPCTPSAGPTRFATDFFFFGSTQMLHWTGRAEPRNVMLSVIWSLLIFIATRAALQRLKQSRPPGGILNIGYYQMVFCNFFKAIQALNIMQAHHHNFG